MGCKAGQCYQTWSPSPERLNKAKKALSPDKIRMNLMDTKPEFLSLRDNYL